MVKWREKISVKNVKPFRMPDPCVERKCAVLLGHKTTNYIAANKFSLFRSFSLSLEVNDVVSSNRYICIPFCLNFSLTFHLATAVKWLSMFHTPAKSVKCHAEWQRDRTVKSSRILAECKLTVSPIRSGCLHTVSFNRLHLHSLQKRREVEKSI